MNSDNTNDNMNYINNTSNNTMNTNTNTITNNNNNNNDLIITVNIDNDDTAKPQTKIQENRSLSQRGS